MKSCIACTRLLRLSVKPTYFCGELIKRVHAFRPLSTFCSTIPVLKTIPLRLPSNIHAIEYTATYNKLNLT